ncbi:hypothetical protein HPP92_000919 [Vanilla planifolia]|uniref:PHD-type domain-containing protein n=1 Tax=Vanilla planifolia TaxID=51239 RepID=A0A835SB10_VANPL|nr:hypothetical protein HPP92_000919 [Vanilla planifolia]
MSGTSSRCNGVLNPGVLGEDRVIIYQRKKRARTTIDQHLATTQNDAAYEREGLARVHNHWTNTLKCFLHLPGVDEGEGIQSCILAALNCYPFGFARNSKEIPLSVRAEDRFKANGEIENPSEWKDACSDSNACGSIVKFDKQIDLNVNTSKCQKVLLDIFCSKNFAFLCNLVSENFKDTAVGKLLDFSLINTKMRNGYYEQLPISFDEDVQQLWSKLRKIGEVMLHLSNSLSKITRASQGKQISEELGLEFVQQKLENPREAAIPINSKKSVLIDRFPLCDSNLPSKPNRGEASYMCEPYKCTQCGIETVGEHNHLCAGCEAIYHFCCSEASSPENFSQSWYHTFFCTGSKEATETIGADQLEYVHDKCGICVMAEAPKLKGNVVNKDNGSDCPNLKIENDKTEASRLYDVYTCKQCSTEAIGEHSLICDGCEAMYHFTCVEPTTEQVLPRNWFCASCCKNSSTSPEPVVESEHDGFHQNCAVCDRLEFCDVEDGIPNGSRESSASSMESDESLQTSRAATTRLCKLCGTCEDEDRRFLVCGHIYCPYKYYHIRCLRDHQIAYQQHQQNLRCWYCPSCLCRGCFLDKDDEDIVLCDGCDEGYHIYCMKPPRTSIPKGQWYCTQCNMSRAKEGMRRYEQWILQQHGKKDALQALETNRPLDILLNAVEKVSSEDKKSARL